MNFTDLYTSIFPVHKRIIFLIMLPVIFVGIITTVLLSTYFSQPLNRFLEEQFDANLHLASRMGIDICETYFQQILDFRLEENKEINMSYQFEALQEIEAVSQQFPNIEMLVIENSKFVKANSIETGLEEWPLPEHDLSHDSIIDARLSNMNIKAYIRYFPFWNWHVISFIPEKKYRAPISWANQLLLFSTLGVFVSVFIVLLIVFNRSIVKPLNRLIVGTKNVSEGKLLPVTPVRDNEFGQLIVFFNEMVENLRNKDEHINKSLQEKDILLKEIHHRVKNNLQIINSLMALQADTISDNNTLIHLRDIEGRIKTMGIIHEHLYKSRDFTSIFLDDYLYELVEHLFSSYMMDSGRISWEIQAEKIEIDLNASIPCGLILNEIISNAFKYAFPGDKEGSLQFTIDRIDGHCRLTVSDDGIGFPDGIDLHNGGKLGMQLITSLTKQLNGTVELKLEKGTEYTITFPLNR